MKHLVQIIQPDGSLPPDGWKESEGSSPIEAAVAHLRQVKPEFDAYPLNVCVSIGDDRHPNGAPFHVLRLRCEAERPAATRPAHTSPTADDIKHELRQARYADGRGAWDSMDAMVADVSAELRRRGIPHSPAHYDTGGNCLTCGESGRCPGVHTFEEIQAANRMGGANEAR